MPKQSQQQNKLKNEVETLKKDLQEYKTTCRQQMMKIDKLKDKLNTCIRENSFQVGKLNSNIRETQSEINELKKRLEDKDEIINERENLLKLTYPGIALKLLNYSKLEKSYYEYVKYSKELEQENQDYKCVVKAKELLMDRLKSLNETEWLDVNFLKNEYKDLNSDFDDIDDYVEDIDLDL